MIAIVNFGMGNPGSIRNMLARLGVEAVITSDATRIEASEKIILPGVGAFDCAMRNLRALGLWDVLTFEAMEKNKSILGICLGAQILTRRSEEGVQAGFGWINAETIRFRFDDATESLRVPHVGWNTVRITRPHPIFSDMGENPRFYFVHSYHIRCRDEADILATTKYGEEFQSAVCHGNIIGTQFHPEKSHKFGMKLLGNFVKMPP